MSEAAVLCPSFYRADIIHNPTGWDRFAASLRAKVIGWLQARRAVGRVLEIVALPQVAERLPRQLSGGQQQRIALARCMVYQPSIIVMDEGRAIGIWTEADALDLDFADPHTFERPFPK